MPAQPTETTKPQVADFDPLDNLHLYIECESAETAPESGWALPRSLVDAFAEATGWELAQVGNEIKIVDMSASWPAKTPTAHREKCDRLVEELSKLL